MRTLPALIAALALATSALAGCSTESEMRAQDPGASESPAASAAPDGVPTAVPAADGTVRTRGLATVLDAGKQPQLCLGAVAESFPPQCTGLPMADWDWAAHPEHEEAAGVRWGLFAVTGTFDGTTFTATEAIPAALYDPMAEEDEPLGTPCEEPEGGWVVDAARTGPEALDATMNAAAALPDLAMTWLHEDVINVAVTEDTAAAEQTLRETWGGGLCVSTAAHTERELQGIQSELNSLPGMLVSSATQPDQLGVEVVHDDGSIQAWADEQYGDGLVEVTSALVSAG